MKWSKGNDIVRFDTYKFVLPTDINDKSRMRVNFDFIEKSYVRFFFF